MTAFAVVRQDLEPPEAKKKEYYMILPPRESASRRCSGLQNARRLKQGIHSLGHRVSYASRSTFRKSSGFQLLQWNTAKNAKMDG
jgi:hypothetical protein